MTRPHVSDFALLAFLEAEHGVDIDWLRQAVADRVHGAPCDGMHCVGHQGLRFHLSGGTVVAVDRIGPPQ